jgi:FkbM family methyltransferase
MTLGTFLLRVLPPRLSIRLLVRRELANGEPELGRVLRMIGKGLFLDVGANRGLYSYVANSVGFEVLSFEPNPRLATYIRRWSSGEVEVREELVSSYTGGSSMAIPLDSRGNELDGLASAEVATIESKTEAIRELQVPSVTLDSLSLAEVEFIKIDVEGHELEVLKGARATLASNCPILQVEIEERHKPGNIKNCDDFLAALGYRCYFVRRNRLLELPEFSMTEDQNVSDIGNRDKYINNFYFVTTDEQLDILKNII